MITSCTENNTIKKYLHLKKTSIQNLHVTDFLALQNKVITNCISFLHITKQFCSPDGFKSVPLAVALQKYIVKYLNKSPPAAVSSISLEAKQ